MRHPMRAWLGGFVCLLAGCDGPMAPAPTVVELTVSSFGPTFTWLVADSRQLSATVRLSGGTTQEVTGQATWSSSAPGVMNISPEGLATAVTPGQAEITASYQGHTGRLALVVEAPGSDRLALLSISPPRDTTLRPGQTAMFTASLVYALASADCGDVAMVVMDQGNQSLLPRNPEVDVTRGAGTVTLAGEVTVPATNVTAVRVFLALFPCGATRTSTVVSVTYAVR